MWENFGLNLSGGERLAGGAYGVLNGLYPGIENASLFFVNITPTLVGSQYWAVGITGDHAGHYLAGSFYDVSLNLSYVYNDTNGFRYDADLSESSFLVRETVAPIPTAIWLFGSGLVGLFARKKPRR